MMGAGYAIRIIVLRRAGFEAAGLYQSAWNLAGVYVGFILASMGADFYPRLTAVAKDNAECNRLVNEQAQISLLLAGPGVLATMTFAPLVIALCYSSKFMAAVGVLRWFCLGLTLQVVAWPMGFVVVAKNKQQIFFWTELAAALVQVALGWICIAYFGLAGAGMSFFGLYVWHSLLIYWIVRRLSGFRWSAANRKLNLLFLPLSAWSFAGFICFPFGWRPRRARWRHCCPASIRCERCSSWYRWSACRQGAESACAGGLAPSGEEGRESDNKDRLR